MNNNCFEDENVGVSADTYFGFHDHDSAVARLWSENDDSDNDVDIADSETERRRNGTRSKRNNSGPLEV
jgi:hypothetical protein